MTIPDEDVEAVVLRRFGKDHEQPCARRNVLTCAMWKCQVRNRCQTLPPPPHTQEAAQCSE